MESQEVLETTKAFHNCVESKQTGIGMENGDNLNVGILEDLDTMMEDIDNGLRITRMVSDSMIKGIVKAVEQEADEKIKAKELELASLRSSLPFLNVNGNHEPKTSDFKGNVSFEDACVKHDKMKESVIDQFKKLRKQIDGVKGCKIKRNGSCHEMVGLGGILKEEYENGFGLEKTVDNLENIMNDMSKLVDTMLIYSKTPHSDWKHEHESKGELEDMAVKSQSIVLTEKFGNISDLRNELKALTKLIPNTESGNLVSHGSFDVDNTHGNLLRSQLSSKWEENGKSNESKPDVPDSFDANSLNHMTKEQMVSFFNNMISKKKREHEAEMHEMTEKYITLKGKYLSERGSLVLPNKEFEVLKRKIPEVVSKLDVILSESDEFIGNGDNVANLNTLLRENRRLRDSLAVKNDEMKNHKSLMADTFLEASVTEDVYKCFINELNRQIQDTKEESELEIISMHDIYDVLLRVAKNNSVCVIEDTCMESLFMQELLETVFKESLFDVKQKFNNLLKEYLTTSENLVFLEKKATEMEVELILEAEERERLKNECNILKKLADWQETVMLKSNKELDEVNDKLSKAENKLSSDKMELNSVNKKLELAMEEIKVLNEHKNMVVDLSQEKQSLVSLIEAKEKEHRKQMEAVVVLVDELSAKFVGFESRVTRDILNNNTRLSNSRSQLSSLTKAANVLKSTGILYKQTLERKCSDLQMAEDEVDLLGDEVETLIGLLEKIYIALDHYSPVLQHYPGVIEILELVRREISGESLKAH